MLLPSHAANRKPTDEPHPPFSSFLLLLSCWQNEKGSLFAPCLPPTPSFSRDDGILAARPSKLFAECRTDSLEAPPGTKGTLNLDIEPNSFSRAEEEANEGHQRHFYGLSSPPFLPSILYLSLQPSLKIR